MARGRTQDLAAIREAVGRIVSTDDVDPYAKVGVYGPNGSGKTRFAATAPDVLIIDTGDKGTRSTVGSGAMVFEADTFADIGYIYWYLKSGKHKYKSFALDTVTGLQRLAMSMVLGEADERNPSRPSKQPDKRDYGRAGQLSNGMLYAFHGLPMHAIFTARERTITDEDTGAVIETTLDLPAGVRGVTMDLVGILGWMEPKRSKGKRVDTMRVGPHSEYRTKDRTNQLGDLVIRPTMPKVIEAWNNVEE
jgi:hypothetical protein